MKQPFHVDMDDIERMIEASAAEVRKNAEAPGPQGALARMQLALTGPYTRQIAEEINRGTSIDDVAFGFSGAVADLTHSMALTQLGPNADRLLVVSAINEISRMISRCLKQSLQGEVGSYHPDMVYEAKRGGNA